MQHNRRIQERQTWTQFVIEIGSGPLLTNFSPVIVTISVSPIPLILQNEQHGRDESNQGSMALNDFGLIFSLLTIAGIWSKEIIFEVVDMG